MQLYVCTTVVLKEQMLTCLILPLQGTGWPPELDSPEPLRERLLLIGNV